MKYEEVNGVLVDTRIFGMYFRCDYSKCHGRCCHYENGPQEGVALLEYEDSAILKFKKEISYYCTHENEELAANVPIVRDWREGISYTRRNDKGDCVFRNNVAGVCALKLATLSKSRCKYTRGLPLRCRLAPLDFFTNRGGQTVLQFDDALKDDCREGFKTGYEEGIHILEFLREPITKVVGEKTYNLMVRLQRI